MCVLNACNNAAHIILEGKLENFFQLKMKLPLTAYTTTHYYMIMPTTVTLVPD